MRLSELQLTRDNPSTSWSLSLLGKYTWLSSEDQNILQLYKNFVHLQAWLQHEESFRKVGEGELHSIDL